MSRPSQSKNLQYTFTVCPNETPLLGCIQQHMEENSLLNPTQWVIRRCRVEFICSGWSCWNTFRVVGMAWWLISKCNTSGLIVQGFLLCLVEGDLAKKSYYCFFFNHQSYLRFFLTIFKCAVSTVRLQIANEGNNLSNQHSHILG